MTNEELRRLDVAVAENVFKTNIININQKYGWKIDYAASDDSCNSCIMSDYGVEAKILKHFSSKPEDAWFLLHQFKSFQFALNSDVFTVSITTKLGTFSTDHANFPLAICTCALKAAGFEFKS